MCGIGFLEWTNWRAGKLLFTSPFSRCLLTFPLFNSIGDCAWLHVRARNLCERCIRSNCWKVSSFIQMNSQLELHPFSFQSAFKTSDYPVILSFENHCNPRQQVSRKVAFVSTPFVGFDIVIWWNESRILLRVARGSLLRLFNPTSFLTVSKQLALFTVKMWNYHRVRWI